MVKPYVTKQNTSTRASVSPEERLIATLRFLATGRSYEDLKFSTGIPALALGYIPETCKVIYEKLKEEYMKVRFYKCTFYYSPNFHLFSYLLHHDSNHKIV
jgi:hypothetical protein